MKSEKIGDADLLPTWDEIAPSAAERHRRTLAGLADVDAGRLIDDEAMRMWVESLGTDAELPPPTLSNAHQVDVGGVAGPCSPS